MDKISSNPAFNYAQLYQQNLARQSPSPAETAPAPSGAAPVQASSSANFANDYSSMFGDDELAKLQRNLEAIAKLADTALRRFEA